MHLSSFAGPALILCIINKELVDLKLAIIRKRFCVILWDTLQIITSVTLHELTVK